MRGCQLLFVGRQVGLIRKKDLTLAMLLEWHLQYKTVDTNDTKLGKGVKYYLIARF